MRRADRLFQLVQLLSADRNITAQALAEQLQVSTRTIYRDVDDLSRSGVPVYGTPGEGYRLLPGYQLPPLCFNTEELEALLLGIRMVEAWADKSLGQQAHSAMLKIQSTLPERLLPELQRHELMVPNFTRPERPDSVIEQLRRAVRRQHKVRLHYCREDGEGSERTLRPLGLFFWGAKWTLVGWCELRDAFRHFRLDRIQSLVDLEEVFEVEPGRTLTDYLQQIYGNTKNP